MFKKTNRPARLERAEPVDNILQKDLVVRISFTTLIILAIILFMAFCFLICKPTYGFFWY